MTLCFWRGMWWRRSWFSLNCKADTLRSGDRALSYAGPDRIATMADPCTTLGRVAEVDIYLKLELSSGEQSPIHLQKCDNPA